MVSHAPRLQRERTVARRVALRGALAITVAAVLADGATRPVQAQELTIFANGNVAAVQSGPREPTRFPVNQPYVVTYIMTYHYFSGGMPPGAIGLRHRETGTVFGPWPAVGGVGQGGVPNAYWIVRPNVRIPPGTYRVIDSHPPSWSTNAEAGYVGFATVKGFPAN